MENIIEDIKKHINSNEFKAISKEEKIKRLDEFIEFALKSFYNPKTHNSKSNNKEYIELHKFLIKKTGKMLLINCKNYKAFNNAFPYTPLYLMPLKIITKKFFKFNTEKEIVYQLRIFNITVVEYSIDVSNSKKKALRFLPFLSCDCYSGDKTNVFYLKINRFDNYAFWCFQHWINIINRAMGDFYIVCDNKELELEILRRIKFKNKNIKFIKSIKNNKTEKMAQNVSTPRWRNAAFAHFTPFLHADKNGFKNFWNIDADDTMLCIKEDRAGEFINKIKEYSNENGIDAISLDMHTSKFKGKHWSFGVTYVNSEKNWEEIFEKEYKNWQENYREYDKEYNLDWFFTYLRDEKIAEIKTFYINNLQFIHFGEFFWRADKIFSGVYQYKDGRILFPFLLGVYGNNECGDIPVFEEDIKFDFDLNLEECFKFMSENKYFSK